MARTTKTASEMRSAVEEMMVPIAEGMRKTIEQMMATTAEEVRRLLVATIRDVVDSLVPELVITLIHLWILSSNLTLSACRQWRRTPPVMQRSNNGGVLLCSSVFQNRPTFLI
ncbi:hypothetical protein Tcan_05051 [Toxocara canis]|uniref:Uncharacterized protein n=1 Tax=Toxocara canis TaxID=6265 RepID=A0A0B2V640_TOXCA|nr:hypothetical protein Tcan_05051 [Toxocara canis]